MSIQGCVKMEEAQEAYPYKTEGRLMEFLEGQKKITTARMIEITPKLIMLKSLIVKASTITSYPHYIVIDKNKGETYPRMPRRILQSFGEQHISCQNIHLPWKKRTSAC